MFRFPNPGSDIDRFIQVFIDTFSDEPEASYSIDDISQIMATNSSASAVGSIGVKAFQKSQTKNKSLNSIYNQAKSYVELYRWLGWAYAADLETISLTAIGKIIVSGEYNVYPLFTAGFIYYNSPNENIKSKSSYKGYPILNILITALKLDGKISRDEIILGPLNEKYEKLGASVEYIKNIRNKKIDIKNELLNSDISVNTQRNYTRLVLSGLKYTNLMGKKGNEYILSEKGKKIARKHSGNLLSLNDIDNKEIYISSAFYNFLDISNFDLGKVERIPNKKIYGSPYQTFTPSKVDPILTKSKLLPEYLVSSDDSVAYNIHKDDEYSSNYTKISDLVTKISSSDKSADHLDINLINNTEQLLQNDMEKILKVVGKYKKDDFYPFIGELFRIIGFNVKVSPNGQNAQRADIVLTYGKDRTVPVEVKSKTEVSRINIKSIEQAIENKIILESRQYSKSRRNDSTFVVGFEYPSSKRENELVNACNEIYKTKIALFSAKSLITMAKETLDLKKTWDIEKMITGKGRIKVE